VIDILPDVEHCSELAEEANGFIVGCV
jgi:hypothetical protein